MNFKYFLRLHTTSFSVYRHKYRFYSSRNVLKLQERGMYEDMFPDTSANEIIDLLNKSPQCVYAGFDPTADSLHVGNLLVLMNLLHWQRGGHRVIAVMGGATGLIGDPSHRKRERVELDKALLEENIVSIKKDIQTIFENHNKIFWVGSNKDKLKPLKIINNIDWYVNLNVIEFVRDIGKYFRLGPMLGRSSVQSRLNSETGMSFTEFTYQIFQAYDWYRLLEKYDCRFQVGGSDQFGNIVSGHDLIAKLSKRAVYGLTLPLLTGEGGKKFGKSLGNPLWLSPKKSSSFQLYQFFIRTPDSDVEKLLKLFTFLPLGKINEVMEEHVKAPEKRAAQKLLAQQVTLLVHGESGLNDADRASLALYDNSIESLAKLNSNELIELFQGASIVDILPEPGTTVFQLAVKAKCFKTEKDASRIIKAGGFYINHQRVTNLEEIITPGIHVLPNNLSLIRVGKKTYHVVKWLT